MQLVRKYLIILLYTHPDLKSGCNFKETKTKKDD